MTNHREKIPSAKIPREIEESLLIPNRVSVTGRLPQGMSGALILLCDGSEKLALRRWPKQASHRRVDEIHRTIAAAATRCGLFPRYRKTASGETYVKDTHGYLWELSCWISGEPIAFDASIESIALGSDAIFRTHQAFASAGNWTAPSQAIADRIARLGALRSLLPQAMAMAQQKSDHPVIGPPLAEACRLLRSRWELVFPRMLDCLRPLSSVAVRTQNTLRDVHRDHVLFSDDQVVGIIDFDAIRPDHPMMDLVRWVGSFGAFVDDPTTTIDAVLAGYRGDWAFLSGQRLPETRKLMYQLAQISAWISLANWVVWIAVESRQFPDWQRVSRRMGRLINQCRADEFVI